MNRFIRWANSALLILIVVFSSPAAAEDSELPLAGACHFSEEIFNMLFSHPVDDSEEIREPIKRATTTGTSAVVGDVSIDIKPDSTSGRIDFRMKGTVSSGDAIARQRQVRVYTNVFSRVDARKSVFFDQEGLHQRPATASCPTNIKIKYVRANRNLIQRLATRRSHRELAEVESIVAQRTSRKFRERLDDRIGSAMETFEDRLRQQLSFEDEDFEFLPPEVSLSSTDAHLQVWIKPQSETPGTAPPSPEYLDPAYDIHVVLHEQVFAGLADYRLAGRRIHDEQVAQTVDVFRGNVPWSLWVHSRRPRWSIKMADTQPVDVKLQDGLMRTSIRLSDFQYGSDVLHGPIQIALDLKLDKADGGIRLRRMAPTKIVIHPSEGPRQEADERLVQLLRQKLDGIFPPESYFDRMQPPAGGSWDKVGSLALSRLHVDNEWFEMAFKFGSEPETGKTAIAKPTPH
jgi:hypothetical protein